MEQEDSEWEEGQLLGEDQQRAMEAEVVFSFDIFLGRQEPMMNGERPING